MDWKKLEMTSEYIQQELLVERRKSMDLTFQESAWGTDKETKLVIGHAKEDEVGIVVLAKKYIHTNFSRKINVGEIAGEVFVSQYHFSRIFKRHTQYSPYQYLMLLRLQYARELMIQKQLSIKEISFRSGFNRVDYFSAAFTKKFKLCPSVYRKQLC